MLVEKNEISEIIENILGIDFDKLELVGKYDNYFDTLLYKSNNELYTIQIYENKISSISKVEKIESAKKNNNRAIGFAVHEILSHFTVILK